MSEVGWTVAAAVVMVVGLCGVVIPILPGLSLIWLAALVYGFAVGFGTGGVIVMVALSALLAVSMIKSVVIPRRAAEGAGASGWSQVGGVIGAVAGFFLIPVIGVIVGALVGILLVEVSLKGDWGDAWTATVATAKGFGISALVDLGLGLIMIALWSAWAVTVVW